MAASHEIIQTLPITIEFAPERQRPSTVKGQLLPQVKAPAPFPRVEGILALIEGTYVPIPDDPVAEARAAAQLQGRFLLDDREDQGASPLAQFAEACYRFGGWTRVASVQWQLDHLPAALTAEKLAAIALTRNPPSAEIVIAMVGAREAWRHLPPTTPNVRALLVRHVGPPLAQFPAGPGTEHWADALVQALRKLAPASYAGGRDRMAAASTRAVNLARGFRTEVDRLRARLYRALVEVEQAAHEVAKTRVVLTQIQILDQGVRLLGEVNGEPFYEWRGGEVASTREASTPDYTAFLGVLATLDAPARAVQEAQERLFNRVLDWRVNAFRRAMIRGVLQPNLTAAALMTVVTFLEQVYELEQKPEMKALRQRLSEAQTALARELTAATVRFPVLFRYSVMDLIRPTGHLPAEHRKTLYRKLTTALAASENMLKQFEQPQPLSASVGSLPSPVNGPLETALAKEKDVAGTVWSYPNLITDGLASLLLPDTSLAAMATERMLAAVAQQAAEQQQIDTAVSVAESALTIVVTVACPPVGLALDVGLGIADAVSAVSVYRTQSDEYFCALNPADAFADVEPSMLPVAIAFAGVALSVAFP